MLPGHRLEISDPELTEGATVEVCIVLQEKPAPARLQNVSKFNKRLIFLLH